MRRCLKTGVLVVCLLFTTLAVAAAQVHSGAFTLSPMIGYQGFDSNLDLDDSAVYGLAVGYNASSNWAFELDLRYAPTEADLADSPDVDVWTLTANALYHFMPEQALVPYLVFGVGVLQYNIDGTGSDDEDFVANWGGGVKYAIADQIDLRLDLRHTIDFRTDNRGDNEGDDDISNNLAAMLGLNFQFGR